MTREQRLESALVGLLSDLLDQLDGEHRDLGLITADLLREFDLYKPVAIHRGRGIICRRHRISKTKHRA